MRKKYQNAREKRMAWYHSKKGVLLTMYRNQLKNSRKRGHPIPEYTHHYLYDRFLRDPVFCKLYEQWVAGGYSRWDKPSIDRIDPSLPYTKTNIQMMSYRENARKADEGERARTEVIMCDLDGTELRRFRSVTEAAAFVGGSTGNIGECCKDMRYTAKGYRWKYGDVKKYGTTRSYETLTEIPRDMKAVRYAALAYWKEHPEQSASQVAKKFGVGATNTMYTWKRIYGLPGGSNG